MKAVNIFTVGVVGLHQLPGVLLLSVCTFVSASIPSLGGDPHMGRASARGALPILSIEDNPSMKLPPPLPLCRLCYRPIGVENLNLITQEGHLLVLGHCSLTSEGQLASTLF